MIGGIENASVRLSDRGDCLSAALGISRITFAALYQDLFNPFSARGIEMALQLRCRVTPAPQAFLNCVTMRQVRKHERSQPVIGIHIDCDSRKGVRE